MTAARGALFLTAPPDRAVPLLAAAHAAFPGVTWTVYYRVSDREALGAALDGADARSDKPSGSKLAFVRELRTQRFDHAVVLWTGHRHYDRPKLLALLAGARRTWAFAESAAPIPLDGPSWRALVHARWRPSLGGDGRASFAGAVLTAAYKYTLGALVAFARLGARVVRSGG